MAWPEVFSLSLLYVYLEWWPMLYEGAFFWPIAFSHLCCDTQTRLMVGSKVREIMYMYYIDKRGIFTSTVPLCNPPFLHCTQAIWWTELYGPECYLMLLTDHCRFLNCSVRMGGGGVWRDFLWIKKVFLGGGRGECTVRNWRWILSSRLNLCHYSYNFQTLIAYFISQGIAYGFSVNNTLRIFQFILAEASHAFSVHGYWKI